MDNRLVVAVVILLIIGVICIGLTLINLPRTETEEYEDTKSATVFDESFSVPPEVVVKTAYFNENDALVIAMTVTSGFLSYDIDFSFNDGVTTYFSDGKTDHLIREFTVPSSADYNFVFDNSFSISNKGVEFQVTKTWEETAYREVENQYPILPSEFAYVGLVIEIIAIVILVAGLFVGGNS